MVLPCGPADSKGSPPLVAEPKGTITGIQKHQQVGLAGLFVWLRKSGKALREPVGQELSGLGEGVGRGQVVMTP